MLLLLHRRDVDGVLSPDEVPAFVHGNQMGIYVNVVLATLVIYDSILTFDKEVRYFWNGCTLNMTKTVFFLNRYVGIFGAMITIPWYTLNTTLAECNVSQWGKDVSYWATIIAIDYILMIRVLALYHNSKRLTLLLYIFLVLDAIGKAVFVVIGIHGEEVGLLGITSSVTACSYFAPGDEDTYILDWTIPLVYEAILLVFALYKATEFWKSNGLQGSRLVCVLAKDQVIYFALAISCSVLYIVDDIVIMSPALTSVIQAMGSPTLLCILGSRMFFNLKEAARHGVNVGTNWSSYLHTTEDTMHFDTVVDDPQFGEGQSFSTLWVQQTQDSGKGIESKANTGMAYEMQNRHDSRLEDTVFTSHSTAFQRD